MKLYDVKGINQYPILMLVANYDPSLMDRHFIDPFFDPNEVLIGELYMGTGKRPRAVDMDLFIEEEIIPLIDKYGIKYIVFSQGDYFKRFTGESKTDANVGYVLEAHGVNVIYVPAYTRIFYDPDRIVPMVERGFNALIDHVTGNYSPPGSFSIKSSQRIHSTTDALGAFEKLMNKPALTVDIEAYSLTTYEAGVGTIAFSWSQSEGYVFDITHTNKSNQLTVLLKTFLDRYTGKLIFHHCTYDISALIGYLYMDDITDTKGLLEGLKVLTRDFEDTKVIAYLATNTCAGNNLSLKDLAQPFAGNFAEDEISDITQMDNIQLMDYNLVDTFATWYVYDTYKPLMIQDEQEELYETYFKPFLKDIIQMQLTGLPIDMKRVYEVESELTKTLTDTFKAIESNPHVEDYMVSYTHELVEKRNAAYKKKRVTFEEIRPTVRFNPNSSLQLSGLLYEHLDLPILDTTASGAPSTGKNTLGKLKNQVSEDIKELIETLLEHSAVDKLLAAFLPAFKKATYSPKRDWHYLTGSFNLGGTVSGRLSGSNPNLQQLPSGGKYGRLIKSCFRAPKGFLLIGLDFASLEDRISALLTKDSNKLKVYLDGYDGHSLRAHTYFSHLMEGIDPDSVESINSIRYLYPDLRDRSKAPTFLLTYNGTHHGLVKTCGFPLDEALSIEERFHTLYKESREWVQGKLAIAEQTGYVTGAFGLRVRTPLLAQTISGNRATPREAEAEGRTAANALGQSWCMLNNRAVNEFLSLAQTTDYATLIRPCAQIHDASYYEVPEDIDIVQYVNTHLVEAVNWNDHPDIYHPEVGLGGELSIFYPSWANEIELPNGASKEEIIELCRGINE